MIVFYETAVTDYFGRQEHITTESAHVETVVCLDNDMGKALPFRGRPDIIMLVSLKTRSLLASLGIFPCLLLNDSPVYFRAQNLLAAHSPYTLNQSGVLLPFTAIADHPLVPDQFFLKSDEGNKRIPGQIVQKSDLSQIASLYKFDTHSLCLVAPVVPLRQEMRFWIGMSDDDRVTMLANAPYAHDDRPADPSPCEIILERAPVVLRDIASRIHACSVMVVDLALTEDDRVVIVEINSACTSGTYGAANTYLRAVQDFLATYSKPFSAPRHSDIL